jgi:hypothetical protein
LRLRLGDAAKERDCDQHKDGYSDKGSHGPVDSFLPKEGHALHARDLKAFAATYVLAGHHVIAPQHVGLRLGELGAIPVVSPGRQAFLFGPHEPLNLVFGGLLAVGASQGRWLFIGTLVEKIAFFHFWALSFGLLLFDYCTFAAGNAKMRIKG